MLGQKGLGGTTRLARVRSDLRELVPKGFGDNQRRGWSRVPKVHSAQNRGVQLVDSSELCQKVSLLYHRVFICLS